MGLCGNFAYDVTTRTRWLLQHVQECILYDIWIHRIIFPVTTFIIIIIKIFHIFLPIYSLSVCSVLEISRHVNYESPSNSSKCNTLGKRGIHFDVISVDIFKKRFLLFFGCLPFHVVFSHLSHWTLKHIVRVKQLERVCFQVSRSWV